jgi:threonine dehydratase
MASAAAAGDGFRYDDLVAAQRASAALARRTPVLTAASLSERCGGAIALKAENLQRTGSFKLRGTLNKLRSAGAGGQGVVAGSAGNHAQSLAYAARHFGRPCEVFMPVDAAVSKLAAVHAFGATVHQEGDSVDACVELARARAAEAGLTFVHPFDDVDVIAGQAGVGVELLEDVPDLAKVVVPVGGGGLASGVALAIKLRCPGVVVVGVQAEICAPFPEALRTGTPVTATSTQTIADGIAVKRPGDLTLAVLQRHLDGLVTVGEHDIADAMVLLVERSKLIVEGAGAASLAALLSGRVRPAAQGTTVAILSGGNVDIGLLAAIAAHGETQAGRRARLLTRVADRPGGLAGLLAAVAAEKANVISVDHVRDGIALGVRETGVELTVETRGRQHVVALVASLKAAGYELAEIT